MNLWARLLPPQSLWNHALFRAQTRAIRWGQSWVAMRDHTLLWLTQELVVILLGWVSFGVTIAVAAPGTSPYWFLDYTQAYCGVMLFVSLLGSLVIDFGGITAGAGVLSGEITSGRYDLVRISMMTPARYVTAKYMLAQVKAWRETARLMWLRVLLIVFGVLIIGWGWFRPRPQTYAAGADFWLFNLLAFLLSGLAAVVFVLEPYWRMKAVTAIGVALSARSFSGLSATLASGIAMLAFWFGQMLVFAALLIFFPLMFGFFFLGNLAVLLCAPLLILGVGMVIYGFYSTIQHMSLRHAAWRLTYIGELILE